MVDIFEQQLLTKEKDLLMCVKRVNKVNTCMYMKISKINCSCICKVILILGICTQYILSQEYFEL
jgi:hypothetical protein